MKGLKDYKALSIRIIKAIIEALFPARCLACRSFFHPEQLPDGCLPENGFQSEDVTFNTVMAPFLCPTCITGFLSIESPVCSGCGIMFKSREGEDHLCGECLESPKRFRTARALGIYDKALMTIIHCFKYNGKIQLARPLGTLLFSAFISYWDINSIDTIVPVPLHVKRFRMRGFNQAFLLVKDWDRIAEVLNVKIPVIQIDRHLLIRSRWTEPQTGLGRKKRMANIKNAFSLNDSSKIIDKRILLVDDVLTTGATADECAKVLLKGGARQVDVLSLARAV